MYITQGLVLNHNFHKVSTIETAVRIRSQFSLVRIYNENIKITGVYIF